MNTVAESARSRGTYEERSAAMRLRLLDATIESLAEKGFGATTTLEVQQRAGVSRGALLHHYASRMELMIAAVEHLTRERLAALHALAAQAPPRAGRIEWAVRVLWTETFEGPLFTAALELWLAARNDVELRTALVPLERSLGAAINEVAAEVFGPAVATHPQFATVLEIYLDAMRGAAARQVLRSPNSDERLLAGWTQLIKTWVGAPSRGRR